jgi:hypothetical protein
MQLSMNKTLCRCIIHKDYQLPITPTVLGVQHGEHNMLRLLLLCCAPGSH